MKNKLFDGISPNPIDKEIINGKKVYEDGNHDSIIAIGGGTIGDLGGFIASTILRGIKFTLIPTTLLSQADSSIGGENGIRFFRSIFESIN